MLLEVGRKYIPRNKPTVKYIEVLRAHSASEPPYSDVGIRIFRIDGQVLATTAMFWSDGIYRENRTESDHDLVAIYEERVSTVCSHPRKTNVSFSIAHPVWACAICGCDWAEPKKEQINLEFEII